MQYFGIYCKFYITTLKILMIIIITSITFALVQIKLMFVDFEKSDKYLRVLDFTTMCTYFFFFMFYASVFNFNIFSFFSDKKIKLVSIWAVKSEKYSLLFLIFGKNYK